MMEEWIKKAEEAVEVPDPVSSRLQSRVYSTLIRLQQEEGPLKPLSEHQSEGTPICSWEAALSSLPLVSLQTTNLCAVCLARISAEHIEGAGPKWPGCIYTEFCKH